MRILVVTPYPPLRDGIAAYAVQSVAALRAQGHDVEVLSPGPSAAHHHLDLVGPRGALALAKRVRSYDKVIVQFHPDFFYPSPASTSDRIMVSAALAIAFRLAHRVEVVVHEVNYLHGRGLGLAPLAARLLWRQVDTVWVHSETERESFRKAFGVRASHIALVDHGANFVRHTVATQAQARASLGIEQEAKVFLSIGFVQPHKGFDRAVRAFAGLGSSGARLDVVGSVRVEEPAYVEYAEQLKDLAAQVPGAHVHLGYVSDELFDRWIVASDVVVLPYREIWSSSVMERALLFGRRVIATRVGALAEQAGEQPGVRLVHDDDALRTALRAEAGLVDEGSSPAPWPTATQGRDAIQREVQERAALRRGYGALAVGEVPSRLSPSTASAPLRRIGALRLPDSGQGRGVRVLLRRVVRRLTAWEMQPLIDQVNGLQRAAVESIERTSATLSATPTGSGKDAEASGRPGKDRA